MLVPRKAGRYPNSITCDNGPEFTSINIDDWASEKNVGLDFITPGIPTDWSYLVYNRIHIAQNSSIAYIGDELGFGHESIVASDMVRSEHLRVFAFNVCAVSLCFLLGWILMNFDNRRFTSFMIH